MITYLDTSFLIKAYIPEVESAEVAAILVGLAGEGAVSVLTDVEITSALHRRLPAQDVDKAYFDYQLDRKSGSYSELKVDDQVFSLARQLAEKYAAQFLLRSLDILHLAIALHHGAGAFATYDARLSAAVGAVGLQKVPLRS